MSEPASGTVLEWTRDSCAVHALVDARVVFVTGEDARTWLNGQTTNDVREVGADAAVYALSVDVKGRIQADLWVVQEGDGMAFVAPAQASDALLEALERHVIMEDVELTAAEDLAVATVQGPHAERVLGDARQALRCYRTARLGAGGFDVWVPRSGLPALLEELTARARELGGGRAEADAWRSALVRAGVPSYGADFGATTYPQEVGLKGRAVSFQKGCYLGQEVICMLENRGRLARRLVRLEAQAGAAAEAGEICLSDDGTKLGQLTSVTSDEPRAALALVKTSHAAPGCGIHVAGEVWNVTAVPGEDD